ncbi:MAG: hypothetical protein H6843_05990 [Rhodospirillaceae bacterium]|nr:hypothetical protein [Rhodospirillaceae bacterium]
MTVGELGERGQPAVRPVTALRAQLCLALALAVQAGFGTPTPDAIGAADVAVGLCLLGALWWPMALRRAVGLDWPGRAALGSVFVLAVLWGPLVTGAAHGWPAADILRDIIPMGLILLPVWVDGRRLADCVSAETVHLALGVAGCVLAGRFFVEHGALPGTLGLSAAGPRAHYLANSPLVWFAALYWPARALAAGPGPGPGAGPGARAGARRRRGPVRLGERLGAALLACLPAAAAAATTQRGLLVLMVLVAAIAAVRALVRRPDWTWIVLMAALGLAGVIAWPWLGGLVRLVEVKTHLVGWNHHLGEVAVVTDLLGRSLTDAALGLGWGALVDLPAIPDLRVSFLHSAPLYLAAKTGLVGLTATAALLLAGLGSGGLWWPRDLTAGTVALAATLVLALLVLPGFKAIDFAFVVLACALSGRGRPTDNRLSP